MRDFFRPNHWPNTPDILTEFLQTAGRSGFMMRFLLASLLGANYGIYGPAFEQLRQRARASRKRRVSGFGEVRNSSLGSGSEQPGASLLRL